MRTVVTLIAPHTLSELKTIDIHAKRNVSQYPVAASPRVFHNASLQCVSIFTSVGLSVFFYYSCEILKYLLIYHTFVDFKSSTCHVLLQVFSSQTCHFTPSEYVLFLLQETRINARKKQLYPLHTVCRSQLGDSQDCFYLVKNQKKTR